MNAININDGCTRHDKISKEVSYKHVNFFGEYRPCERTKFMHDKYYKVHRYERTRIWLIEQDDYAKELCSLHSLTFAL